MRIVLRRVVTASAPGTRERHGKMSHLNAIPVDMCGLWSGENRLIDLAFLFVHGNLGESSIAKAVCDIQNILATTYQTDASIYQCVLTRP